MRLGEVVLIVALFAAPLYFLLKAWGRYAALDRASGGDLFQMQIGLALVSLAAFLWVAVLALMFLEDYSAGARSVAQGVSPGKLALFNLLLCAAALTCALRGFRSAQETIPLRRSMGISSGCLMLGWFFLAINPH